MLEASTTIEALLWIGGVGAVAGLFGGILAGADNLLGTILMGIIGSIAAAAILRIAGADPVYGVGNEDFSIIWGALGGLLLGFVVGRSNV